MLPFYVGRWISSFSVCLSLFRQLIHLTPLPPREVFGDGSLILLPFQLQQLLILFIIGIIVGIDHDRELRVR